jgi:hypothetical protein
MKMNEDRFVHALREVETSPPDPEMLNRLRRPTRVGAWLWAVPASAASVALVALLSAQPALSLAQVARAQGAHAQYTIVNTRIMGKGHANFKTSYYRDGKLWRRGAQFGLTDRTVTVRRHEPLYNFVELDDPRPPVEDDFRIDRLLRHHVKPKIERNVPWNGRQVDRFSLSLTYRAGKEETFDQEVIADPKTHLPIRMTIMRDSGKWGDVWDYNFEKPPSTVWEPQIDPKAKVYDNRKLRKELAKKLVDAPVAGVLLDEFYRVVLLMDPNSARPSLGNVGATIEGISPELTGSFVDASSSVGAHGQLTLGGRQLRAISVGLPYDRWSELRPLRAAAKASGQLTIGARQVSFSDVPVVRIGQSLSFLSSAFGRRILR